MMRMVRRDDDEDGIGEMLMKMVWRDDDEGGKEGR